MTLIGWLAKLNVACASNFACGWISKGCPARFHIGLSESCPSKSAATGERDVSSLRSTEI